MRREKFNEIYTNVILNLKRDLDEDDVTKLKFFAAERIYRQYQLERNRIKKNYMKNPDENIDRHKIAASMLYAIMQVCPVYVPFKEKIKRIFKREVCSPELSYINEYIAIYTALSILDNFYEQDKKESRLNSHRHKIYIPDTFAKDYGYIFNMCIELKFAKMRNKINTLTYANILFLIEYQHILNNDDVTKQK